MLLGNNVPDKSIGFKDIESLSNIEEPPDKVLSTSSRNRFVRIVPFHSLRSNCQVYEWMFDDWFRWFETESLNPGGVLSAKLT